MSNPKRQRKRIAPPPPTQGKIALHAASDTPDSLLFPSFTLKNLARSYCISLCTRDEKAGFANTVHVLSQMSWAQIHSSDRHGSGCERLARSRVNAAVTNRIPKDANIYAFRFYRLAAMVGYKGEHGIFFVVGFDRNFAMYDHA